MKAWVFAGQGTQYTGMGASLFPLFSDECDKASTILGYSLVDLCLDNPGNKLSLTQYAQPAIYFVNALSFLEQQKAGNKKPEMLSGHSLGEYNALHAAGVIDLYKGLELVQARGKAMAQATHGGMLAVIGDNIDSINDLLFEDELLNLDIANYNSSKQVVLSGDLKDLQRASTLLENKSFRCVPLEVSAAFHSHYMQDARLTFTKQLINHSFNTPNVPVFSPTIIDFIEKDFCLETLSFQFIKPVYWTESVKRMQQLGVTSFHEISPGDFVLTRLISKIL